MKRTSVLALCSTLLFASVDVGAQQPSSAQIARGPAGAVATAHPLATAAALHVLEAGGNAADAAVAAAFAISVVEPSMNSIGGRTQILVRSPDGTVTGIDATTQAPHTYDPETAPRGAYGYATVGVPGAVAGLMRLHTEHGRLPREQVVAPAIEYAARGFRLLPGEARRQAGAADQVGEFEGGRYFQEADGTAYDAGDLFVQEDLAETLRVIAEGGHDAFYRGPIADRMLEDLEAKGAAVTRESLDRYRAVDGPMVFGSYRGYDLSAMHLPTGGAVAIQILHILENFDLGSMDEVEWASVVGQAMALAFGDARRMREPGAEEWMTSKAYAAEQAAEIVLPTSEGGGGPIEMPAWPAREDDDGHTTHLSVADGEGMAVSLTQTIGPAMGSKVVAPGLGFVYAATLGGYLGEMQPGERAPSFIAPLVVSRDGEPVLVLGAAGGARIVSAVVQAVLRVVDQDRSLADALAAPRVHPGFGGDVELETSPGIGFAESTVEALRAAGLEVRGQPGVGRFGRLHALRYHADTGEWEAVADPDWEGTAAAPTGR